MHSLNWCNKCVFVLPAQVSDSKFALVQLVQRCQPNPAHLALAAYERKAFENGREFTLITQVLYNAAVCIPWLSF